MPDTYHESDAAALDYLAEFVRLPEWRVRGSGVDWIEAVAEVIGSRRDVTLPPSPEFAEAWQ